MKRKGFLIVFEGGEGCGKSTQLKLLAQWLEGQKRSVLTTFEPGDTPLGVKIREWLLHNPDPISPACELLLYMADRAQHAAYLIRPALEKGQIILSDRLSDSSLVYQGICRKMGAKWVGELNHFALSGIKPDLVFILDIPVKTGLERAKKRGKLDRMEREPLHFHEKVRSAYRQLAKKDPRHYILINADNSIEAIATQIQTVIRKRFLK